MFLVFLEKDSLSSNQETNEDTRHLDRLNACERGSYNLNCNAFTTRGGGHAEHAGGGKSLGSGW